MEPESALAPLLCFDDAEPFLPKLAAVTVFSADGPSQSFPTDVTVHGDVAVEYALWWPCEIGHLYELEHVWVHGRRYRSSWTLEAVEGSAHGGRHQLDVQTRAGRPVVYLEPGKHGTAIQPDQFALPRDVIEWLCGSGAGREGVWVTPLMDGQLLPTPVQHRQARRYLQQSAFTPSWRFTNVVDAAELSFTSVAELLPTVPDRVYTQIAAVSDAPLRRAAGPLADPSCDVAVVAVQHDDGFHADGVAFTAVLDRIRAEQRELVVFLDDLPAGTIDAFASMLRRHWCVTATSLVCSQQAQYDAARRAGVTVIADRRDSPPAPDDDWVCTADDVTDTYRVLGPGGDIELVI